MVVIVSSYRHISSKVIHSHRHNRHLVTWINDPDLQTQIY